MKMAEDQAQHRWGLERRVVRNNIAQSYLGQAMAFLLASGICYGGFVLLQQGKSITGSGSIITAVGCLIGVFVYGRRSQERERLNKRQGSR